MSERWGGYRTTEHFRDRLAELGLTRADVRPVLDAPDLVYDACERVPGQNPRKDGGRRLCGLTPGGVPITVVTSCDGYLLTISPWMQEGYARSLAFSEDVG